MQTIYVLGFCYCVVALKQMRENKRKPSLLSSVRHSFNNLFHFETLGLANSKQQFDFNLEGYGVFLFLTSVDSHDWNSSSLLSRFMLPAEGGVARLRNGCCDVALVAGFRRYEGNTSSKQNLTLPNLLEFTQHIDNQRSTLHGLCEARSWYLA